MQRHDPLAVLNASPGGRAWGRLQSFRLTTRIVGLNGRELLEGILDLSRPPLHPRIWAVENEADRREYHAELIRLLHNYLAAVKTLVDHTRRLIERDYSGHTIAAEYKAQTSARFATSTLASFVQDLRNYSLHVSNLPTALVSRYSNLQGPLVETHSLVLRREALRAWAKWSAQGRRHLLSLTEDPSLHSLVAEYDQMIRRFNEWLLQRLQREHESDIQSYVEAVRKLVKPTPPP